MKSGTRVYHLPPEESGGYPQLQWIADGDLWRLRWHGEQMLGLDCVTGAKYDLATVLPGDARERLCAPDALPTSIWERARAIPKRSVALAAAVHAGQGWLHMPTGWWLHDARLGDVVAVPGPPLSMSSAKNAADGLPELLWNEPALEVSKPPDSLRDDVNAALNAVVDEAQRIISGGLALVDRSATEPQATLIFAAAGRVVWLTLKPDAVLPERVALNPYQAVVPPAQLHEVLLQRRYGRDYDRRWKLEPVPDEAKRVTSQLAEGLKRSKREIIDAYLQCMRAGMTLSGGPTSDQSWTISFDGSGFWMSGYTMGPDGPEQTRDPITEAKIREMLSTYVMFGLNELPG